MLVTKQQQSEAVLGSGDELAFGHVGVRGPWESKRDIPGMVGSKKKKMNLRV